MSRSVQFVGSASGAIAGSSDVYANLPTPLIAYVGVLYYVQEGSGGALSWIPGTSFYKYPAGLYAVNKDVTAWELTPLNVEMAQDTTTVLNIDDWGEFYDFSISINAGDQLIYKGINYSNYEGNITTTPPDQDALNWDFTDSDMIRYYNDLAIDIQPFRVLHAKNTITISGKEHLTPDIADASKWELTQGTLTVSCELIPIGKFGCTTKSSARLKGGDTSFLPAPSQNWLSDDGSGKLTNIRPPFPSSAISMGANLNALSAPNGEMFVNQTTDIYDTFNDAWDGSIKETFDFRVTSDGATIIGTLTNQASPSEDLTMLFSSGFNTLDVTTVPKTLELVAGTTTVIQLNYVFIDKATLTLQTSTVEFPISEHAKIAVIGVFDETITMNDGAIRNQNINDHIKLQDDNGHILHMAERLRAMNAEWDSGTLGTLSGTPTNVYVSTTAGKVWQLHKQALPAQDMGAGDEIHVVNDPVTLYRNTSNLNDIDSYSTGSSWNNAWSNIVVWGVANKTGESDHLMVNLPSDGYNSEQAAIEDSDNVSSYTIPAEFKGVGFLIGRYTLRPSGGTFTYNAGVGYLDLRGFVPNNTAGGGAGSSGVFTAPQYTTAQRDALSPVNGGIIYNTTTDQFNFYENGAWVTK